MKYDSWSVRGFDRARAVTLCHSGVNPLIAVILASRGVDRPETAAEFLRSDPGMLHDPYLLPDMDRAVARLRLAVERGEHVAVYGDYDVDGMTASCVMAGALRSLGLECELYIPGRFDEGYGMNTGAVDSLRGRGVRLIITVDCGITDCDEVDYAAERGIDVIVTDHHECKDVLPRAVAVVDPKRRDSMYPNKALAGVGVAFKVVCALLGDQTQQVLDQYADLVAIGTVADVVDVRGENRELIRRGLELVSDSRRPGLRSLIAMSNLAGRPIQASDVGFSLAPRLNAAGRMGITDLALELLLTDDEQRAQACALELCRLNDRRKQLVSEIYEQAMQMLPEHPDGPIILARRGWYQGVLGIVASRMTEQYNLPCIMIAVDESGLGRGSCRSCGDFHLYEALTQCAGLLENFGGHEMAAGITLHQEQLGPFIERFTACYRSAAGPVTAPTLEADLEVLKPQLLTLDNVRALDQLEPFGTGNQPPRLCMTDVTVEHIVPVGSGQHVRMQISKGTGFFDCIFFSAPAHELPVTEGQTADLIFEPCVNTFRGRSSVQLVVADIRSHEEVRA